MKVTLADGRRDVLVWSADGKTVKVEAEMIVLDGTFARARYEHDQLVGVTLAEGTALRIGGDSFTLPRASIEGAVERVDYSNNSVHVGELVQGLPGEFLHVSNPSCRHESAYRIESAAEGAIRLSSTRLTLARGHLDVDPTDAHVLPNVVPLEYAKAVGGKASGFFAGKRVKTPDGRAGTRIVDIDKTGLSIRVESSKGFRAGDDLIVYDVYAGDRVRIPCWLQAHRDTDGVWRVRSNAGTAAHKSRR